MKIYKSKIFDSYERFDLIFDMLDPLTNSSHPPAWVPLSDLNTKQLNPQTILPFTPT